MKEISTKISYQKNKPSAKFIRSGKCFFFFISNIFISNARLKLAILAVERSGCRVFPDTA